MSDVSLGKTLRLKVGKAWELKTGPLFLAILLQVLILAGTGFVVVLAPRLRSEPEFVAKKTIYLPQRELEHRAAIAELRQFSTPPAMLSRLRTSALLPDGLPQIPELPVSEASVWGSEMSPILGESLLGQSGLLNGLTNINLEVSRFSILGISDETKRLVIAFDISRSVVDNMAKSGMDILRVRDETVKAVESLSANSLFGLIQFSRKYDLFSEYLAPATKGNKEAALEWLRTEFKTTGNSGRNWVQKNPNGIQSVLEAAFAFNPDVLLLISDGSFQRNHAEKSYQNVPWDELAKDLENFQENLPEKARIHFIGFGMKEDNARAMRELVHRYKGRFKSF